MLKNTIFAPRIIKKSTIIFKKIMKKFILSVMAVAALACGLSSCNSGAPKATYANGDLDTLAYAYGVMFGTQYSNFQDSGVVVPDPVESASS